MGKKTTITSDSVGRQSTGVLKTDRDPKITPEARQKLTLNSGKKKPKK